MMVTLPQPNGGFRWTQLPAGPALICERLEPLARHFFTTRPWRLGERTPESTEGWSEIAEWMHANVVDLRRLHQVHGAEAVTYKKDQPVPAGALPRADIVLTDNRSAAVAVQTADCLPILIADRRSSAVAAAHAGWRGLAARVPHVAVERMTVDFGSRPEDLLVAVGPAIGACCYEVGVDVRDRFVQDGFSSAGVARWFRPDPLTLPANPPMRSLPAERRADHWFFDAWACVREQLESAGVPRDQIYCAELCTASHEPVFCSYRRDGAVAGRMVGIIGLHARATTAHPPAR
jgi:polyphenol oxidase